MAIGFDRVMVVVVVDVSCCSCGCRDAPLRVVVLVLSVDDDAGQLEEEASAASCGWVSSGRAGGSCSLGEPLLLLLLPN